jgi:ketosteroid isomerase-like protein
VAHPDSGQFVVPFVGDGPIANRRRHARRLARGPAAPSRVGQADLSGGRVTVNENETLIRTGYDAYSRGDITAMLQMVDAELEWTYLDPSVADPQPQVCHGRGELEAALQRQIERGLTSRLEEVIANGDRVVVGVCTPGIDAFRMWQAHDRTYDVFTVRDGRVVAMRACRDRDEALAIAGIE